MSDPAKPTIEPLQFDTAVATGAAPTRGGVVCSRCGTSITDSYYTVARVPVCERCKAEIEQSVVGTKSPATFAKALVFGIGAAIAGAIVYYGVIALLNIEIGIVAILIGYMVGYAVRKAVGAIGGRRYQILAAGLTYLAVGLAYMPLAINGATGLTLLFFVVKLPVMVVFGSMPSGIISAAIIIFGMRQAWQMTAAPDLSFAGPLRIAPPTIEPSPPTA